MKYLVKANFVYRGTRYSIGDEVELPEEAVLALGTDIVEAIKPEPKAKKITPTKDKQVKTYRNK